MGVREGTVAVAARYDPAATAESRAEYEILSGRPVPQSCYPDRAIDGTVGLHGATSTGTGWFALVSASTGGVAG